MPATTHATPMQSAPVQTLKGQHVKRKADSHKVYIVGDYCRAAKKWQLIDCLDIWGNGLQVKTGTALFFGFDY